MATATLLSHGTNYKHSEVQAPSNIRESNLFISAQPTALDSEYWPTWDVSKLEFAKPVAGSSMDGYKFQLIELNYNYSATGQKPLWGHLEFEMHYTIKDGVIFDLVSAFSGVTPKKISPKMQEEYASKLKAAKKKGKTIELPKTKYRTIIQLNNQNPVHIRFLEIMRQIYVKCLKVVVGALGNKYQMPLCAEADICELNESPNLRYPVMYQRDLDPKKEVIPGSQPAIDLSIVPGGRDATKFMGIQSVNTNSTTGKVEYTVKYYKFDEVLRRGFQHIPRISIPSIFMGTVNLIRMQCPQTYIYKFTNEITGSMGSTLNDIALAGIATSEDKAVGEIMKDVMLAEKKDLETKAGAPIALPTKSVISKPLMSSSSSSSSSEDVLAEVVESKSKASGLKKRVKVPKNKHKQSRDNNSTDSD